jgi:hypothetical protein
MNPQIDRSVQEIIPLQKTMIFSEAEDSDHFDDQRAG